MAEETIEQAPLTEYVRHFERLIGDKRTGETFAEIVRGIINAGSLVCQRIAAQSSVLSTVKDGAQRVIRFATGESTKRSAVDAEHLVAASCQRGVAQLGESQADELWVIADQSDLRKPYASEMPDLMQVELYIRRDGEHCCWQAVGEAGEVRKESVQGAILDAIRELGELGEVTSTTNIARYLGKDMANVGHDLADLVQVGKVVKGLRDGRVVPYYLPD
jgi:hypothetical protein